MSEHIPKGFTALTPYLVLEDAAGFIEFAKKGLGATERSVNFEDGRLVHGELELEGCVFELGQPGGEFHPTRSSMHVFVKDPDKAFARAIEHGATSLYEVKDHEYGERSGGVVDAWDNQWYFAAVTDHDIRSK